MQQEILDVTFDDESDHFDDDNFTSSTQDNTQTSDITDINLVEFEDPVDTELLKAGDGALPYSNEYGNMITQSVRSLPTRKRFKLQLHQLIFGLVGDEVLRGPVISEHVNPA